jgi:hypothetical protein
MAFDLLHDLVDVAIEHRNRSEAAQVVYRLAGIHGPSAFRERWRTTAAALPTN